MFNSRIFAIAAIMLLAAHGTAIIAMQQPDIVDIRLFGLGFPHNMQDDLGNTFWHNLAVASEIISDWSEVNQRINAFQQSHNSWLPNPFIVNNDGKTARQLAEETFNQSGNPVTGLLAFVFLKQQEDNFLNKMALKASRDATAQAQHQQYPNG